MRSIRRPNLTYSMLAIYAGISVLGQGLHWLSPEDGHHHDSNVIGCASHDHAHDHSCERHSHESCPLADTDHNESPAGKVHAADNCVADSHVCGICEFLLLAISQPPQADPPLVSQPLVAAVPSPLERTYSSISLGLHAPRGPPQLLA